MRRTAEAKATGLSITKPVKIQFIEPMYALAVKTLPEGDEWAYEVKWDGYRCLAGRQKGGATLWSRRGNLFTPQFPQIASAIEKLPPDTLIDGEVVAIDPNGKISFNLLQHHRSRAQALLFYAFDVLIHRGKSLLNVPLEERRNVLDQIFAKLTGKDLSVKLSDLVEAPVGELIRIAKDLGFEGLLAKRRDSLYESGRRSGAWLKHRVNKGQEFVIGGYMPNNPVDSIIVGYYDDGRLLYVAKVRNGFVPQTRREMWAKLQGREIPNCPFANLPEKKRNAYSLTKEEMKKCVWVRPELVAQIEFAEWTPDGDLRHSTFVGLREDKEPREVVREQS
jgi:DNA ligase D-like protein (predicted ligase)